ncbi:MAG: HDOD domain-containing protein [Ghiorsea sp.]|nr:HDOD domain-containing protein [Ghiorsea sp.]
MTQVDAAVQDKIGRMVESMPAFPRSVHKVLELTSNMNCAPKDIVEVIEHDPVMTAKMLKLVNSAFYSLPRKITSMKHAVIYIGINTVKNLALSIATVGMLPTHNKADCDMSAFLLHALVTGSIARKLSTFVHQEGFDAIDFFVAGLLHDFGKIVFVRAMPEIFLQAKQMAEQEGIPLIEAEYRLFGADHSQVGAILGQQWKFPETLVQAIAEHHQPEKISNVLRDCVFVANQICKLKQIGHSGNMQVEPFSTIIVQRFGCDMESLLDKLGDLQPMIDEAETFANL